MKKIIAIVLLLALCLTAFVACAPTGSTKSMYALAYEMSDPNMSGLWKPGLESAAKALGYTIDVGDGKSDDTKAVQQLQNAHAKGYDAYLINVVDQNNGMKYLDVVKGSNKPVIFWNRLVEQKVLDAYEKAYYVGIVAEEGGVYQGQMAAEYIQGLSEADRTALDRNGDGKIGVLVVRGEQGHPDSDARTLNAPMYLERTLAGTDKATGSVSGTTYSQTGEWKYVEVCGIVDAKSSAGVTWDGKTAADNVANALTKDTGKEIDLILSNNDGMALEIVKNTTFKATGMPIWGVDALADALAELKKENTQFKGTVKNDGTAQAKVVVQLAYNLINGKELTADLGKVVTTEAEWSNDATAVWYDSQTKCFFVHHAKITAANA